MFSMPSRFWNRCFISRSRRAFSFLESSAIRPSSFMAFSNFRRLMDFCKVAQLVRVPPSQRWFTKNAPHFFASSATASCACRLVPTNNTVLPCDEISLTNLLASRNIFNVFCKSMIWMPLRSPKMYSFILGFQRRVWWPKCTPASSSSFIVISTAKFPPLRIAACGSGSVFLAGLTTGHYNLTAEQPSCRQLAGHDLVPASRNGALPRGRSKRPRGPLTQRLALGELESLSRALLPVLLALLHTRVARQKTVLAQRRPQ